MMLLWAWLADVQVAQPELFKTTYKMTYGSSETITYDVALDLGWWIKTTFFRERKL
ncbi:hypothetical protein Hanom_Chr11g01028621 [Helianthus anomalus]